MLFILNVKAVAEHAIPLYLLLTAFIILSDSHHTISFMSLPDSSFLTWQNPDISERDIYYAHTQYKSILTSAVTRYFGRQSWHRVASLIIISI